MAKTRTEKIEDIKAEIARLENRQKELIQAEKLQERKDRTKRLCKRAGLLESLLPDTISLSDEQFQTFLEKAVANEYGRNTLAKITAQGSTPPAHHPANTAQNGGTGGSGNDGNGARATG